MPRSVIVVGAGPVGMTAATALAQIGFEVTVLEAAPQVSREWRASTFHPPTLEHLERLGVTDEMLSAGLRADKYQIRDRKRGMVAEFGYGALAADTKYPFRLQLEQYKLVEILQRKLEGLDNATIRLGHRVTGVNEIAGGVSVEVATTAGTTSLRADYLIGADGASSEVRKLLNIGFHGWTYEQRFLLISSDIAFQDHIQDLCYVNYIADPDEFVMLLKIPDIWRVLVPVPPSMSEKVATDPARMRGVIEGIIGKRVDWETTSLPQHQLYRVHQRVADTFRAGRVLLMGDAAHVNSPIGGFGLNSGIHDALDLALRFEGAADGSSREEPDLDQYAQTRREVALSHIRLMSDRNTRTLSESDETSRTAELDRLAEISADPQRSREWLLDASLINAVRALPLGA